MLQASEPTKALAAFVDFESTTKCTDRGNSRPATSSGALERNGQLRRYDRLSATDTSTLEPGNPYAGIIDG